MKKAAFVVLFMLVLITFGSTAGGESYMDWIRFGDETSETVHNLREVKTIVDYGGFQQSNRKIGPDGSLSFTLKVDPEKQNYFTVKLWGSDTGQGMLFWDAPYLIKPEYQSEWPEIDYLAADFGYKRNLAEPAFPERFYYTTYMIPILMTRGKEELEITLVSTGAATPYSSTSTAPQQGYSRGIYAVYSHTDPFFEAVDSQEILDMGVKKARERTGSVLPISSRSEYEHLAYHCNLAVRRILDWQLYGKQWEEVPQSVLGAIPFNGIKAGQNWTEQDWKDNLSGKVTHQNVSIMNALAVLAKAYHADWSKYQHSPELVDRVVAGLDFYTIAQGSNGGFQGRDSEWIGGPIRKEAHNILEGFGHSGLAEAFLLLADQIEQLGYLEQLIDHDGNPSTSKVTRGEAYLSMYVKSRDYLVPRGHAPNQFGVNAYAAYLANEAIKLLDPGQAWPQDRMLEHLYIAVGLRTDRYGGSWISPKGLSLEPNGSSRGGYCGNYGPHAIELLANLARVTGDEIIADRARDVVESFQYFQYPAVDARGFHTFRTEGVITWRNNKLPGANGYEISPYMALELEVPAAIRLIQLYLEHNRIYEVDLNWQNVHYLSYVTRAIDLLQDLDALRALPLTDYRLPMERDGDVVFTDEMAGAIALKHNDVRMYVSLNWRHGFRGNERAYGNARPNNIARIHYTTDAVERIANVQMNSPYGFMQLYELDYGEYLIRMNCSQTETYPLTVSEQFTQALDLVTGDVLDLTKEYSIPPQTTLVLYTGTHAAANPVFELQDQLQDPDPIVRRDAVIELGKYGVETAEVLPDLMGLLSDEAAHVRIEVARTLGLIGEAGLPGLIAACEDLHPLVRQTAINSLGNLGVVNSAVKTVLNKGLQDEDAGVRQAAVKAVEKVNLQDENTLVNLGILIGDRELAVALNARTALQNMGVLTETMTVLVESLAESDRRVEIVNALGRLGGYGQQFVPIALDMINSESTEIRYAAVVALESLGSHSLEALPELIGCLEDESSIVKRAALNSLESLGVFAVPDPDLLTVISGLLYDHDRAIKWETARILFNYGFEFAAANPAVLAEMGAIFDGLDLELIHQHLPDLQLAALPRNIPANLVTVKPGEDIQAAIDQLASQGGGTVQLAPGVYEIASPILLRSKIRLSGSGLDTVIIPGSGAEVQFLVYGAGGLIDVIIEDLMLDGGKNRQERQWTWQVDSHTAQPNGLFILDDNGRQNERILISNVAITRTAMGLHSKGTNDLIITDVKAYDNGGVYSYFHNAYLRRNERVLITNSLFADSHTGNGLNLTLQDSVVVYNNLFINNVFRGVRAANSRNLVICRNVASQNKDFGMGTRSEEGGVTDYMIFNNYASLNGVNYSIHSAANGFYDNNISLR